MAGPVGHALAGVAPCGAWPEPRGAGRVVSTRTPTENSPGRP